MKVIINDDAHLNHSFPDWPWYLGKYEKTEDFFKPKYIPNKEGFIFEVEDSVYDDKYQLADKEYVLKNISFSTDIAWIDKKDCTVL